MLTGYSKVLNITCNNASSNDTMVEELEDLLDGFGGKTNRTRCFEHVVNLVARTVTRQFDTPKAGNDATANVAKAELAELAKGIKLEDLVAIAEDESEKDENCEDWIDERDDMTSEELDELEESVRPVTHVLVKVSSAVIRVSQSLTITHAQLRKLAFAVANSTTILLPMWFGLLDALKMSARKIPRDVTTRWNSTYNMLLFALEYREAIDKMSGDKTNNLREYELSEEE